MHAEVGSDRWPIMMAVNWLLVESVINKWVLLPFLVLLLFFVQLILLNSSSILEFWFPGPCTALSCLSMRCRWHALVKYIYFVFSARQNLHCQCCIYNHKIDTIRASLSPLLLSPWFEWSGRNMFYNLYHSVKPTG